MYDDVTYVGRGLTKKTLHNTIPPSKMSLKQVYRMCSVTIECVLLLQNVFSYYRMFSVAIECVLLLYTQTTLHNTIPPSKMSLKQV